MYANLLAISAVTYFNHLCYRMLKIVAYMMLFILIVVYKFNQIKLEK